MSVDHVLDFCHDSDLFKIFVFYKYLRRIHVTNNLSYVM